MTALTLFDLDHTLIPLDSNQEWVRFLIDRGLLEAAWYSEGARRMEERYRRAAEDIDREFCEFFTSTLTGIPADRLAILLQEFTAQRITPRITPAARALVAMHRHAGDTLAVITATNRIVAAPIAHHFGIEHLLATEPELVAGTFTGRVTGVPSMRSGKVIRLVAWLRQGTLPGIREACELEALRFYSDSINDLALLEYVGEPIAVDPDESLQTLALQRGWPIISLSNPSL